MVMFSYSYIFSVYIVCIFFVSDILTSELFQLFSIVCKLLAIFMRTFFYILGSYFSAIDAVWQHNQRELCFDFLPLLN